MAFILSLITIVIFGQYGFIAGCAAIIFTFFMYGLIAETTKDRK